MAFPGFGVLTFRSWKIWAPPVAYLIVALILALVSDQKNISFFGNYGRNMGWTQQLGFTVLFLLTAFSFNFASLINFFDLMIILGFLISFYGFLQFNGIDFVSYKDSGLPIIATLGNPNFASAFIGLSSIALVWKITHVKSLWQKLLFAIILIAQVQIIHLSKSSQGLFVLAIGSSIYIGIRFFSFKKSVSVLYFSLIVTSFVLGFLGLLQIGPLKNFVFQNSTTYRGDYYRAAWEMFKSSPFTGVGFESFGIYFRSFRDSTAALRLGPQWSVDYAHNNFLQLLATGGIILLFAYLVMMSVVIFAIKKGFEKFDGNDRYLFSALVSIWFGFQLQEQVSVGQLTLTSIGWVLSGAIVALGLNFDFIKDKSFVPNNVKQRQQKFKDKTFAYSLTCTLLVVTFLILAPRFKAEQNIYSAKKIPVSFSDLRTVSTKEDLALSAVAAQPKEIKYHFLAADVFLTTGNMEAARMQLRDILELNPKSDPAMVYLASLYEYSEEWDEAIKLRIIVSKLDQNNTINWLQLGKNLAQIGDYQALNKVIEQVKPLADKSTIVNDLKALLSSNP